MLRMTAEQAQRHLERVRQVPVTQSPQEAPAEAHRGPKYKSSWERRFAKLLDLRVRNGEFRSWIYEGMHLRLPGDVMYRVDFIAQAWDGVAHCFEVKGRMREPARIKLRAAVATYPGFAWWLVRGDMLPIRLYAPSDVPGK